MDATQLKRIPIFENVPDEDLRVITTFATSEEVPEGAVIVKEGDFANHFMAIEEGTAKVTRDGEEIGQLGPGDIFGEMGIVQHKLRSATVISLSRLECLHFTRSQIEELEQEIPAFKEALESSTHSRAPGDD